MFRLGIRPPELESYPGLHHPEFEFRDEVLRGDALRAGSPIPESTVETGSIKTLH